MKKDGHRLHYETNESRTKEFILGSSSMTEMLDQEGFKPMPGISGTTKELILNKLHVHFRVGVKDWFDGQDHLDVGPTASIEAVPNVRDPEEPGGQWGFVLKVNRAGMVGWNPGNNSFVLSTDNPQQARQWIHGTKHYAEQSEKVHDFYDWQVGLTQALGMKKLAIF